MKKIFIALLVLIMGACYSTLEGGLEEEFISQAKGNYSFGELKADGHIYAESDGTKIYGFEQARNNHQAVYFDPIFEGYIGLVTTGKTLKLYEKGDRSLWTTKNEVSFDKKYLEETYNKE